MLAGNTLCQIVGSVDETRDDANHTTSVSYDSDGIQA